MTATDEVYLRARQELAEGIVRQIEKLSRDHPLPDLPHDLQELVKAGQGLDLSAGFQVLIIAAMLLIRRAPKDARAELLGEFHRLTDDCANFTRLVPPGAHPSVSPDVTKH